MTEANDTVLETLLHALGDINYNLSAELQEFWTDWLREAHQEATEKGYDY